MVKSESSVWRMTEVEIFADLSAEEMQQMESAAPMDHYPAGELFFRPGSGTQRLFILKKGRVRLFRVTEEGKALTTSILSPGMFFGEMVVVGQTMDESFAESMDECVVCSMSAEQVHGMLLSDARIASRIAATLGARVAELEQRISASVFKSVPQRVAGVLGILSRSKLRNPLAGGVQLSVTHEQLAEIVGTSRESVTKSLRDFASAGVVKLGRGKVTILDSAALADLT